MPGYGDCHTVKRGDLRKRGIASSILQTSLNGLVGNIWMACSRFSLAPDGGNEPVSK